MSSVTAPIITLPRTPIAIFVVSERLFRIIQTLRRRYFNRFQLLRLRRRIFADGRHGTRTRLALPTLSQMRRLRLVINGLFFNDCFCFRFRCFDITAYITRFAVHGRRHFILFFCHSNEIDFSVLTKTQQTTLPESRCFPQKMQRIFAVSNVYTAWNPMHPLFFKKLR